MRDLLLLFLMCLVLYCTGLDTHGVTNWQEAQRVVVSREMQQRAPTDPDAWIVPRHNAQPYIAKPPFIYWCTVGLAKLRGGRVELFDLRLCVALAGTLGVLATYLVARAVLRPLHVDETEPEDRRHITAARWAAIFLATGILSFRSARIGELDILLVPTVVGSIGCIWLAWRRFLERERDGMRPLDMLGARAHWPAIGAAAILASVAALTKGPPALMVIALAGYGGIVLHTALGAAPVRREGLAALIGAGAFGAAAAVSITGSSDTIGVLITALIGAGAGLVLTRLVGAQACRALWLSLAHTHPVIVLGVPALAFWWWVSAVSDRIGHDTAVAIAKEQADNDLNLFMPGSPLRNLEALAYGCGAGSILMLLAAAWWVKYRPLPRPSLPGIIIPIAWVLLSYAALSIFGKGVPRYLTPVWPGVAIIAAAWLVRRPEPAERTPSSPRANLILGAACAVLALTQTWWYALGRETFEHERSPKALMRWLVRAEGDRARFGSFEFYTPALDYYAGAYVQPIVSAQMGKEVAGGAPWTLEELVHDVRRNGPMIILCRDHSLDRSLPAPIDRLRAAGLRVEALDAPAVFRIDNARTFVRAVRVDLPAGNPRTRDRFST